MKVLKNARLESEPIHSLASDMEREQAYDLRFNGGMTADRVWEMREVSQTARNLKRTKQWYERAPYMKRD